MIHWPSQNPNSPRWRWLLPVALWLGLAFSPIPTLAQWELPPLTVRPLPFPNVWPSLPQRGPYVDVDPYLDGRVLGPEYVDTNWTWQFLPSGRIYRSYLAGPKESRLGVQLFGVDNHTFTDATLGSRIGLTRYGTSDVSWPEGVQLDLEGSAQLRLDMVEDVDFRSADYRVGMPLSFGWGRHETKLAIYHISSHLGDEFLLKNPGFHRLNFVRDVFVLGHSIRPGEDWRVYAEIGWAFHDDISQSWELQFGVEYAPGRETSNWGAPFLAINGYLREELDYSGSLSLQAGWSWRNIEGSILRFGLHYFNGLSNEYSFFREHEQQLGAGVWYDF